jgi:hypothetical protein
MWGRPVRLEVQLVREETFTFTPNNGEPEITIRSGALRQWLLTRAMDKVTDLHFPEEPLASIVERHGLEADRMASMTEAEAKEPVIVGLWPGNLSVLIDGGHRRWFWAKQGVHTLRGWAVPEVVWRSFLFNPNDFLTVHHHTDGAMLPQRQKKR